MNQEIKDRWVNALESGEYRQGFGMLHQQRDDGVVSFCCLGVLSDLAYRDGVTTRTWSKSDTLGHDYFAYGTYSVMSLPSEVAEWAGLETTNPFVELNGARHPVSYLNDHLQLPFADIAIIVKEQL